MLVELKYFKFPFHAIVTTIIQIYGHYIIVIIKKTLLWN